MAHHAVLLQEGKLRRPPPSPLEECAMTPRDADAANDGESLATLRRNGSKLGNMAAMTSAPVLQRKGSQTSSLGSRNEDRLHSQGRKGSKTGAVGDLEAEGYHSEAIGEAWEKYQRSFHDESFGHDRRSGPKHPSIPFSDALDHRLGDLRTQLLADHERSLPVDRECSRLREENGRLRQKLQESKAAVGSTSNTGTDGNTSSTAGAGSKRQNKSSEPSNWMAPVSPRILSWTPAKDETSARPCGDEHIHGLVLTTPRSGIPVTIPRHGVKCKSCSQEPFEDMPFCSGAECIKAGSIQYDFEGRRTPRAAGDFEDAAEARSGKLVVRPEMRIPDEELLASEKLVLNGEDGDDHGTASCKVLLLWGGNSEMNLSVFFTTWRDFVKKVKNYEVFNDDEEIYERKAAAHALWPPLDVMELAARNDSPLLRASSPSNRSSSRQECSGDLYVDTTSYWQRLVSPPNSKKRMLWDTLSFILVCWDAFMIPMYAFDLNNSEIVRIMSWITTIFWTMDFPTNFFVAFYSEGVVEMRPAKVALHYLKTWCTLDALVILVDWSFIGLGLNDGTGQASRLAKLRLNRLSRFFRFLQVLRLIRAAKLLPRMQMMSNEIHSEMSRLTLSILRSVLVIVAINHVVACAWFTIAYYNDDEWTWLHHDGMTNDAPEAWMRAWEYRYFTALHWSFCQFTPASVDVHPRNLRERIFTVFIIICGMITFSTFVSSITSSLTQLRSLNTENHQEELLMRQYFNENRVSVDLGKCVTDWLHANRRQRKFRVHEVDLPTFQDLPERLKQQLHVEVFEPILTVHPFFEAFQELDSKGLNKICHRALSQHRLLTEQELFARGSQTNRMYFVIVGECRFSLPHYYETDMYLEAGSWCSEIALWIPWVHLGSLTASKIAELVSLDADSFQQTFLNCSKMVKRFVRAYASLFVRHECDELVEGQPWITDVCCNPDHIEELCYEAREWVSSNFSHAVGHMRSTNTMR